MVYYDSNAVFSFAQMIYCNGNEVCFTGQTGKWGYGKPDNHDGGDDGEDQTCVALDGDKLDGKYNDEDCFNPHGYICENKGITGEWGIYLGKQRYHW